MALNLAKAVIGYLKEWSAEKVHCSASRRGLGG
jgi:hypothetical protein